MGIIALKSQAMSPILLMLREYVDKKMGKPGLHCLPSASDLGFTLLLRLVFSAIQGGEFPSVYMLVSALVTVYLPMAPKSELDTLLQLLEVSSQGKPLSLHTPDSDLLLLWSPL